MVRAASIASAGETLTSAARSARKNCSSWCCMALAPVQQLDDLRLDGEDVLLELQDHVERVADHGGVEAVGVQQDQRAGPVDRLGDRGRLAKVERAQGL